MPSSYTSKWNLPLIAEENDFKIVDDYNALSTRVDKIIPDEYVVSVVHDPSDPSDSEGNTTRLIVTTAKGDDTNSEVFTFAGKTADVDLTEIEERLKKIEDFFKNSNISLDDNRMSLESTYELIDSTGYLTVK